MGGWKGGKPREGQPLPLKCESKNSGVSLAKLGQGTEKSANNQPQLFQAAEHRLKVSEGLFLNPWFGEPVVCTLDSRGFRHFRGFRDFRESSTQLLVCSCLSCLRRFRRFRDFRRFRGRRPAPKP